VSKANRSYRHQERQAIKQSIDRYINMREGKDAGRDKDPQYSRRLKDGELTKLFSEGLARE
jgi:hypothetical protein